MLHEIRYIWNFHFLRQESFMSEWILISPSVFISQWNFITTNKAATMANWIWTLWELHLFSCVAHRGPVQSFAWYLAAREELLCGSRGGAGRGCLVIVCVIWIPNRRLAGSDNSQSSHTLSKNIHITLQGKRNKLPSQTKHSDCDMLFVDRSRAAGVVMECGLFWKPDALYKCIKWHSF